jgi:hypothetical protein
VFNHQAARVFAAVAATLERVPLDVSWMLCVTDRDGYGDDPTYAALTIVAEKRDLAKVREAIGGTWEDVDGNFYQLSKKAPLEVEVVEKGIV